MPRPSPLATGRRPDDAPPLLRVVAVTKRFGSVVANQGVCITVSHGEIHGLLGENGAGKTTLMRLVCGLLRPDEGRIEVNGAPSSLYSPRRALALGIGMVQQHFALVPPMTVAENVALGVSRGRIQRSQRREVGVRIGELSERYGLAVRAEDVVEDLSVGVRQRVEILKLLYRGAELMVLDEPTATLTRKEWDRLAEVLRSLADLGKAVILTTHKLDELFGVAGVCTVLRGGRVVGDVRVSQTSKAELAEMMVGRRLTSGIQSARRTPGMAVLETRGLACEERGVRLRGIDLGTRQREILGIAGVDGNGQHELAEILTGMRRPTAGRIRIGDKSFATLTPGEYKSAGGGVISEDCRQTGLALDLSVAENLALKEFDSPPYSRYGLISRAVIRERAQRLVERYDIRCSDVGAPVRELSGGNQQKVVLARELDRQPRLLIAAQPTRGLDIAATAAVQRLLLEYRDRGGALVLISIELEEVLALADRIAVMLRGEVVQTIDAATADPTVLGLLMSGERLGASRREPTDG